MDIHIVPDDVLKLIFDFVPFENNNWFRILTVSKRFKTVGLQVYNVLKIPNMLSKCGERKTINSWIGQDNIHWKLIYRVKQ